MEEEKITENRLWEDHNILIEIKTQVIRLIEDVRDIKSNLSNRVERLEIEKANECDFKDIEKDINDLQRWRYVIVGIGISLMTITGLAGYIYKSEQIHQDVERANIIRMISE